METFQFTIQTNSGTTYRYEGTLESLNNHLKLNSHLRPEVVESISDATTSI